MCLIDTNIFHLCINVVLDDVQFKTADGLSDHQNSTGKGKPGDGKTPVLMSVSTATNRKARLNN